MIAKEHAQKPPGKLAAFLQMRKTFFWRISGVYLALLLLTTALLGSIFIYSWLSYRDRSLQWAHWELAQIVAGELLPLIDEPHPKAHLRKHIFKLEQLSPDARIYGIAADGKVIFSRLDWARLSSVAIAPIEEFLNHRGQLLRPIYGTNPTDRTSSVIFSAYKIFLNSQPVYLYVVLGSPQSSLLSLMTAEATSIWGSIAVLIIAITLSAVLGVFVFSILTKRLSRMTAIVQEFREGNLQARIPETGSDEIGICAETFNQMAERIADSMQALQQRDTARRQLIADIAHDLRRPITLSRSALDQLQEQASSLTQADLKERIEQALASFDGLTKLMVDFFELAQLEDITFKATIAPFALDELLDAQYHNFNQLAQERGIELLEVLPEQRCIAEGEERLIERCVANLIENALMYTPSGKQVSIALKLEDSLCTVIVRDEGIGIKEDEIEKISERFYRSEEAREVNKAGTGLGLAIVMRILESHGSNLEISSSPGLGTTMAFTLARSPS